MVAFFDASDDLCIDVEALADGNDFFCVLGCEVDFQTMSHVEHLVHLGPVSAALFLNGLEQGRDGEEIVLDDSHIVHEV